MFNKEKLKQFKEVLEFAKEVHRLQYLVRYPTTPHTTDEVVAAHSYQVCILSLFLYEKYKTIFKFLKFKTLMSMALVHDISECKESIGDISHAQKAKNKILADSLILLEYEAVKELLGEEYVIYLKEYNECESVEAILVNCADVISCLIFSEFEIEKGNKYMERVKYESEERLVVLLDKLNTWLNANE